MPQICLNITPVLRYTILQAIRVAARSGQQKIKPEHLLIGTYEVNQGLAITILREKEIDLQKTCLHLQQQPNEGMLLPPKIFRFKRHMTREARMIIETAAKTASRLNHGWLGTEHILLALIIHKETFPFDWTKNHNLAYEEIEKHILEKIEPCIQGYNEATASQSAFFKKLKIATQRSRLVLQNTIPLLGIPRKIKLETTPQDKTEE